MTFTHALSTNNYGPAKFIVSANAYEGTHTTIAAALTSASSGDTIFIRPGTYTENPTLKAGVNLVAYTADAYTPNVTISGTCTLTTAGTVSISGIRLQTNSAFALAVTGSVASIVNLINCYINCSNNTGISFTTSSSSASIFLNTCQGDLGTTGIALFTHSSAGTLRIYEGYFTNSGGSSTASTQSGGSLIIERSNLANPVTTSGTTTAFSITDSSIDTSAQNVTSLTYGGSAVGTSRNVQLSSGTASAGSIGGSLNYSSGRIVSTNTNSITGAGTLTAGNLIYSNQPPAVNVTTQSWLAGTGWQLLQKQTGSSSASIEFKNLIGNYTHYILVIDNITPATNGTKLQVQTSVNNGVSYAASGYQSGISVWNYDSAVVTNYNSTSSLFLTGNQSSSSGGANCHVWLNGLAIVGNCNYFDSGAGKWSFGIFGGGNGQSAAPNAYKISYTSGNIATGTFSMYGIAT